MQGGPGGKRPEKAVLHEKKRLTFTMCLWQKKWKRSDFFFDTFRVGEKDA